MTDARKALKHHVSAAKEWLGKAEQSLEKENDIKGNLNLMLAQAELARACEKKKERSLLIHSMLAAGIVGLVVLFGFSGENREEEKTTALSKPSPSIVGVEAVKPAQAHSYMEVRQETDAEIRQGASTSASQVVEVKVDAAIKKEHEAVRASDKLAVTPVQMQQLMSAAGKSLRGQD